MIERVSDLKSSNRPREDFGIAAGDVVSYRRPDSTKPSGTFYRTEGMVEPGGTGHTDEFGRNVLIVRGVDGGLWFPLLSACVRVDPPMGPSPVQTVLFGSKGGN